MRLSVRTKLYGGFAATALLTLVLGAFALASVRQFVAAEEAFYVDSLGGTQLLLRYVERTGHGQTLLARYVALDDAAARDTVRAEIKALDAELADLRRRMDEADTDREE